MADDLTLGANDNTGAADGTGAPDNTGANTILGGDPGVQDQNTGGTDTKTEEQKTAAAPEEYADFTLPEGVEFDKGMLDKAKTEFKAKGYSQEQAQAAVDLYVSEMKAQADIFNQTRKDWVNEIKTDKEFGGDKFQETARGAQLALRKFDADGAMVQLLETSGFGDHPGVIKFLARVHKALGEDPVHDHRDKIPNKEVPLSERLYGKDGMGPETPQ